MKSLTVCTLLLASIPLFAQQPTMHAPDGGTFERLQSVAILPKPGAPFSATVVTEWTRLLQDGTTTTVKNHRTVARDSAGRIFEERRFFTPNGDMEETRLLSRQYSDPIRHEFYECLTATHVCTIYAYNRPATMPIAAAGPLPGSQGDISRESLGDKRIDSLDLHGSREITTINPGANGYQRPEPTIKEFWYSPRLEINVVTKRFEPRGGAQSIVLNDVSLDTPDPKLFEPPTQYAVVRVRPE